MSKKKLNEKPKEKKEKPRYSMFRCLRYFFGRGVRYRPEVPLFLFFQIAGGVASAIFGFYMSPKILACLESHSSALELLLTAAFFIGGSFLSDALTSYIGGFISCYKIELRSRILQEFTDKCAETSYCHCYDNKFMRSLNRALGGCSGNSAAAEGTWYTIQNLGINLVMFFFFTATLTYIHPVIFAVTAVLSVANFAVSSYVGKYNFRHREELAHIDRQERYLFGLPRQLSVAKDIRLFGLAGWISRLTDQVLAAKQAYAKKEHTFYLICSFVNVLLEFLRSGVAIFLLLQMCLKNGMAVAEFMLYFSAVNSFNGRFSGILNGFLDLKNKCLDFSCMLEFLDYPEPYNFGEGLPIPGDGPYEIRLENVSYTYPESEKKIIENLNLTIGRGEKIAIVGLNGAGKTTLVKLITGLLDPDEGRVLLNGIDIRRFNRRDYYALFSAVFQHFNLYDITVAETVAQSATEIDLPRVKDCLEKAGLTKAVSELPQGLSSHLGRDVYLDGVVLSGGQTQRLMLARALYKNGDVLVLDEPTAALDPLAERDFYQKYSAMSEGKTSLFISHRLASTRFCDRVLYLKEGKIAEEGTHESLLALGKEYAHLFHVQARYYQEDYQTGQEGI